MSLIDCPHELSSQRKRTMSLNRLTVRSTQAATEAAAVPKNLCIETFVVFVQMLILVFAIRACLMEGRTMTCA